MNKYPKNISKAKLAMAISAVVAFPVGVSAQNETTVDEEVLVTGIRASLSRAIDVKRESTMVSDSIASEDLGKFPDLNLAESLQRLTGVSIDRNGGEGQRVTVRGLGPEFNLVLLNGRQIAVDSGGREFSFDTLAADQISGTDIYKSTHAHFQEGGIGATVNVKTARPLDFDGFRYSGSIKGIYETLSEEMAPAISGLVSNTFADGTLGVLAAVSYQERKVQINRIETVGWRPGITLSNNAGDDDPNTQEIIASNVFIPRNWDQIVDQQDRTRTNATLVFQYAPNDDLTVTLDGFISKFEVASVATDMASWFEGDRVGEAVIADNGTALFFTQEQGLAISSGDPRTDFVSYTRNSRDINNAGVGINFEYFINDNLKATVDISNSTAEDDQAGKERFNVIGITNSYQFDSRGSMPVVTHGGFENGGLPDARLARAHYNERNGFTDEDEITEFKADFEYESDGTVLDNIKFGLYSQSREKSRFQKFDDGGCIYCGYHLPVPEGLLRPFVAENYFDGIINRFYAYDGEAYLAFLETPEAAAQQDQIRGFPPGTTASFLDGGFIPELQNNRYTIQEDIYAMYLETTFQYEIADMPVAVNIGARYSETTLEVDAIQSQLDDIIPTQDLTLFSNVLSDPQAFSQGTSYTNLLPSFNVKLDIHEDMVLRYARYETLTRPTLSLLSPATVFGSPRAQELNASGGNPELEPFQAENWDISYEWYFGETSIFSVAFFNKEVQNFIVRLVGNEDFTLSDRIGQPNERCNVANSDLCGDASFTAAELSGVVQTHRVTRPQNGEDAEINGFEIALTHTWDWGFGFTINATAVDSNAKLDPENTDETFALEGLGDSQNLILFYERDRWQARLAFNNRETFLRSVNNGFNTEPVITRNFGQWDMSASYDINDALTVFIEGINITEEELTQTGRFANQIMNIEDNGSRFALGLRAAF